MKQLLNSRNWVCWKREEVNGRVTKVPYNALTGGKAMSNNPDTWCSFKEANDKLKQNLFDGVGLMFSGNLCGIDIDGANGHTDNNELTETIFEMFEGTYSEVSPSGTGIHILFKCDFSKLPLLKDENGNPIRNEKGYFCLNGYKQRNDSKGLECYISGITARYFTYTGNQIGDYNEIVDKTPELLTFLEKYMKDEKKPQKKSRTAPPSTALSVDLSVAIDYIRNKDDKFVSLYDNGDLSPYDNDSSRGDLALCNILAFYLKGDFNAIDTAFKGSALYRDKWERQDYKKMTIDTAIKDRNGEYYNGNYKIKTETPNDLNGSEPFPEWLRIKTTENGELKGYEIREPLYMKHFVKKHGIVSVNDYFYNEYGEMNSQSVKKLIQEDVTKYFEKSVSTKVNALYEIIRTDSHIEAPKPDSSKIFVKGKTLTVTEAGDIIEDANDKTFTFNRLNVEYNSQAPEPVLWKSFINDLLYPEDIATLQEYMGYCLIPTTAAQTALFIIGKGGEGKSRIGNIMQEILGGSMIAEDLHKLAEDRFILSRIENKLLYYSDELENKKLKDTGVFKTLVTNEINIQAEAKNKDKYSIKPYARFLCCGNQAPTSLADQSDGFYRRLLILSCKPITRTTNDRNFSKKLAAEKDSIFKWCVEGLQRLVKNSFNFTLSERAKANVNNLKQEENNVIQFMNDSTLWDTSTEDDKTATRDMYNLYLVWCYDNVLEPIKERQFTLYLSSNQETLHIQKDLSRNGTKARGYKNIKMSHSAEYMANERFYDYRRKGFIK